MNIDEWYTYLAQRGIPDPVAHRAAGAAVMAESQQAEKASVQPPPITVMPTRRDDVLTRIERAIFLLIVLVGINLVLTAFVLALS